MWQTYRGPTQTKGKISKTLKILPRQFQNGEWTVQCLTDMGEHSPIKFIQFK
jgi:hypothetical protein